MNVQTSSRNAYLVAYVLLMILLAATVAAGSFHLGDWALPVALLIAAMKIALIATIFMHLSEEPLLIRILAIAGVFWLGILLTLLASDYLTRHAVTP